MASGSGWAVPICWVCHDIFPARISIDWCYYYRLFSVDGQVKLFDLRGPDYAAKTWNIHPNGLSAFDVHPIAHVFAAYVYSFFGLIFVHPLTLTVIFLVILPLHQLTGDPNGLSCKTWPSQHRFPNLTSPLDSTSLQSVACLRLSYPDPVHSCSILCKCCMLPGSLMAQVRSFFVSIPLSFVIPILFLQWWSEVVDLLTIINDALEVLTY